MQILKSFIGYFQLAFNTLMNFHICSPFELTALVLWKCNLSDIKTMNESDMMIHQLMEVGGGSKNKRKNINKALLCVCQEYKTFVMHRLSHSGSSIHLHGNQDGSEDILEAELHFTAQLLTISSAQAISNAVANRLCVLNACLIPQKTDFMLFISVSAQMQLLSTERLLANEHSSSKEGIAFMWCLLQRRSSVPLFLQLFHLVSLCKKRVKKATPSLCCADRLFPTLSWCTDLVFPPSCPVPLYPPTSSAKYQRFITAPFNQQLWSVAVNHISGDSGWKFGKFFTNRQHSTGTDIQSGGVSSFGVSWDSVRSWVFQAGFLHFCDSVKTFCSTGEHYGIASIWCSFITLPIHQSERTAEYLAWFVVQAVTGSSAYVP